MDDKEVKKTVMQRMRKVITFLNKQMIITINYGFDEYPQVHHGRNLHTTTTKLFISLTVLVVIINLLLHKGHAVA
jgi:hypothetical protein